MREIKFRGKRIDNGEWVYGFYGYKEEINTHFIVVETINLNYSSYFTDIPVDPVTVGQYTGIKDKNGKEIYEGDILRFLDAKLVYTSCGNEWEEFINTGCVEYFQEIAKYIVSFCESVDIEDIWFDTEHLEVIGNIRDNPELLEGA